jgi:hypothetical protein
MAGVGQERCLCVCGLETATIEGGYYVVTIGTRIRLAAVDDLSAG